MKSYILHEIFSFNIVTNRNLGGSMNFLFFFFFEDQMIFFFMSVQFIYLKHLEQCSAHMKLCETATYAKDDGSWYTWSHYIF